MNSKDDLLPPTLQSDGMRPSEGAFLGHAVGAGIVVNKQLSIPLQDLSDDKLLALAPRADVDGRRVPRLGKIPLLARLGTGGMSAVYYGIHPSLRLEVAVKILPLFLAQQDPVLIERFFREAQTAARVRSPHLVHVSDVDEENKLFYIVMEYVSGKSAAQHIRDTGAVGGKVPESEALEVCIAATKGLAAAHSEGIVHRDVKPANIMIPVKKDGVTLDFQNCKLADLGLARAPDSGESGLTTSFQVMGTPGYMAPEQVLDAKNAGKPADVWGMGATLYALLVGHAPFPGKVSMQVLHDTVEAPHKAVSSTRPDVRMDIEIIIDRCLAKDPAKRYQDASEMLEALHNSRFGRQHRSGQHAPVLDPRRSALGKTVLITRRVADSKPPQDSRAVVTTRTLPEDTTPKEIEQTKEQDLETTRMIVAGGPSTVVWKHTLYTGWPFKESDAIQRRVDTSRATGLALNQVIALPGNERIELTLLPAGKFVMGSPHDEPGHEKDELAHYATLSRPFYMGLYPVTQGQWMAITGKNPSRFHEVPDFRSRPVERVSWNDIQKHFMPGLQQHAPEGWAFRLPSEAEWEYACRAGSDTAYHFGNELEDGDALVKSNETRKRGRTWVVRRRISDSLDRPGPGKEWNETAPVGSYEPNAFGLFDMHGQVWEWCQDTYEEDAYAKEPCLDPLEERNAALRVLRGGSWNYSAKYSRSGERYQSAPDAKYFNFGFRVALVFKKNNCSVV